jgi:nicotinate dehydrogenase subunit A
MPRISLTVNGTTHSLTSDPRTPLALVLRNELGLTGTKIGCGAEQCGACAVLVDGEVVLSCVAAIEGFNGRAVTTIEGLGTPGELSLVQQAFVDARAAQCGYCTPGLVIAVTALAARAVAHGRPSRDEIGAALAQHLCRCGSHVRVLDAVARVLDKTPG